MALSMGGVGGVRRIRRRLPTKDPSTRRERRRVSNVFPGGDPTFADHESPPALCHEPLGHCQDTSRSVGPGLLMPISASSSSTARSNSRFVVDLPRGRREKARRHQRQSLHPLRGSRAAMRSTRRRAVDGGFYELVLVQHEVLPQYGQRRGRDRAIQIGRGSPRSGSSSVRNRDRASISAIVRAH